jgi:hypothetical protein
MWPDQLVGAMRLQEETPIPGSPAANTEEDP